MTTGVPRCGDTIRRDGPDPVLCRRKSTWLAAAFVAGLSAVASPAAPIDAHAYAADTAREIASLVRSGATLRVDVPEGYYQLAVVAQLRARGFTVREPQGEGGTMVRCSLVEAGADGRSTVDLVVRGDMFRRTYDPQTGRPVLGWTRQTLATKPPGQSPDEPYQLFLLGRSVEKEAPDRAIQYYRLASGLGQTAADLRLGLMLIARGRAEEGLRYVARASDAGDPQAGYVLGLAYRDGTGVAKDPVRAERLLRTAAAAGIPPAGQARAVPTR